MLTLADLAFSHRVFVPDVLKWLILKRMGLFEFLMIANTTKQEIVADLGLQSLKIALLGTSI